MDYLSEIVKLCKCSVTVQINDHRDYYRTAEMEINEEMIFQFDTTQDIIDKMIELDTIISVHCYNLTPNGSYTVHHYDLNSALKEMYETLIKS